ncbi:acetyl-CoA carboxylase biotin carboxylase subunit [Loigolactobacillus backii]|uniref:biotin carboxylase n=1 Tax=Loigolactobacillus backii TaxID=375175 RepID=A0A192H256_9LACO|nr:biotin carboxylase N-terminal domain-containing protein [Loigolactobacillus backii]ANK59067.1 acetyl-CoA carboxylase biotin carboxylase subunit [Loigolactobacillus backii]ANK62445.1 acetyl-CoA carboxylase biotin carboxylase subunit [Loigolactobacillus backii]ANK64056.1 acetyl-CoA carboxylase biotin carboxylase subunit [Loigolactobacillus backii]ANK67550.1 acetyl-CoA carboxylase biotin carboxylase subunit [Loigolactobacillus backii]ANK70543.1 acetyl-CoA carboxylase biotin carboxylase subunit
MFKRVLIANRGEVALRIIQACRKLKIETVAIYAKVEENSRFVQAADFTYCVGPNTAQSSYLNREGILMAALLSGADAIHPGYGFLAEDALFAEMCAECDLTFIGPKPAMIRLMADKAAAKNYAKTQGVPIIPGASAITSANQLKQAAQAVGYPVMLKASLGGGGKGMRVIYNEAHLQQKYHLIQEEAQQTFLNDAIYLEKYLTVARHIEVQILKDHVGNLQIVGDRECSLQLNHQKVVEESSATILQPQQRQQLYDLAKRLLAKLDYCGLGTLEFLFANQQFYFLEMNTRLQVEHGVTELTSGIDLVTTQIKLAAGQTVRPGILPFSGHAIEVRLNAQADAKQHLLATGKLTQFCFSATERIDTGYQKNDIIQPYYDALLAKLIVSATTREQAIAKMQQTLKHTHVTGVGTNLATLSQILNSPAYNANQIDIHFLEQMEGAVQ